MNDLDRQVMSVMNCLLRKDFGLKNAPRLNCQPLYCSISPWWMRRFTNLKTCNLQIELTSRPQCRSIEPNSARQSTNFPIQKHVRGFFNQNWDALKINILILNSSTNSHYSAISKVNVNENVETRNVDFGVLFSRKGAFIRERHLIQISESWGSVYWSGVY